MPSYRPAALTGATREEQEAIHRRLTNQHVYLSPDGSQIMRQWVWHTAPAARAPRNWTHSRSIKVGGMALPTYLIAHILRVGPDGPLIGPGPWVPIDGDWLNVHPDNWPPTALF